MNDNFQKDFEDSQGHVWLNAASEGPLPRIAAERLTEAVRWKSLPYQLDMEKFQRVPKELKRSIARLIDVPANEVILANSASYGIHLLANGLPLKAGDEVVVMQNDFPTDILPWLALEKNGVVVKQVPTEGAVMSVDELAEQINQKTKVVCLPHVHTFSGQGLDLKKMSVLCQRMGAILIVNISQSTGGMPVDVQGIGADAVVCAGYKWLLGPYGTGFCWMKPEVRRQLSLNQSYWISAMSEAQLESENVILQRDQTSARKYDVFGTANFFNFVPFTASINYLLDIGLQNIYQHNQRLVNLFLEGLDRDMYSLLSESEGEKRSNLIVISHKKRHNNKQIFQKLLNHHVYPAFWKGNIRISPHIFNTSDHIERVLNLLNNSKSEG